MLDQAISGLVPYNDVVTPTKALGVSPGVAADKDGIGSIVLESAMLKRIDAPWARGSGSGGLDSGNAAPFTSYHVHLISGTDGCAVDILFSTSPTEPQMPPGFTRRRRIGIVQTTTGGAILPGTWRADGSFEYRDGFVVVNGAGLAAPALSPVLASAGIKRKFRGHFIASRAVGAGFNLTARDPDVGIPDANTVSVLYKGPEVLSVGQTLDVWTDTASRIYLASSPANAANLVYVTAIGWVDLRDEYA